MARKAARRKAKHTFEENFKEIETAKINLKAQKEGPKKKSWSVLDIKAIKPITEAQRAMAESFYMGNHIVADGSAGTGKTYLAMWLALNTVLSKETEQEKIILVRSAVASRDIGFLPGTMEEKMQPFEIPYKDILHDLMGKFSSYDDMSEAGIIKFMPTSFVRGTTWDNSVVVIDEAQNLTLHEINSVITRIGKNSKIILCGDYNQNDLVNKRTETSGFQSFLKIASLMDEFDIIKFTRNDIVRSKFVKSWICAMEDAGF